MKKPHLFLILCLWSFYPLKAFHAGPDTLDHPVKKPLLPMKWELLLGCNYLTNTQWVSNRPFDAIQTTSGAFYTYIDIPLKKKYPLFKTRMGIGANIQTFGLDKRIRYLNERTIFVAFQPDLHYRYSTLQQLFIELPLSLVYQPFHNYPFEVEAGGTIGYQVYSEHRVCIDTHTGNRTETKEQIKNLNPLHYGCLGKISFSPLNRKHPIAWVYTLSGNYYISELFKPINDTPTKNFSILLGIGFHINTNGTHYTHEQRS